MALKLYFCGSVRGGRQDAEMYVKIVSQMKKHGHVLTEDTADPTMPEEARVPSGMDKDLHDGHMDMLMQADAVIAEATQPSLGVGYELGRAIENKKKTLILFRPDNRAGRKLSAMIRGANTTDFIVKDYMDEDITDIVDDFILNTVVPSLNK